MTTLASAYRDGWRQVVIYSKGPAWIKCIEVGTLRPQPRGVAVGEKL